ncbi:RHS repeat-associated core domain-containing protein [Curtobacterium sp. L1-20]|uniref:RHS repeat-associated core domain-containing protein n=1 Tax=Curtobacterium sp. L1-20 TaxID=3138181 RepID=UPI003B51EFF6
MAPKRKFDRPHPLARALKLPSSRTLSDSSNGRLSFRVLRGRNLLQLGTTNSRRKGRQLLQYRLDDRVAKWLPPDLRRRCGPFTGHTNTGYDTSGRPSEVRAWTGQDATKKFDTQYSYTTTAGADSDQLQTTTDVLTGKITTYGYKDPAGNISTHLTGVTQTGGSDDVDWAFSYDADGNRLTAQETGAKTFNQTLTFNGANQITSSGYSYDGAGNMTASPGATYTYNGAEQMTTSTANGTTTQYTYAGASQSQLLSETTAGGPAYTYTYGCTDGTGVPEIDTETTGTNTTSRVLSDAVTGQALDLTDSSGDTAGFLTDGIGNQIGALTDTGTEAFTAAYDPYGTGTVNDADATNPFWTQNPYGFKAGTRTSDTQNNLVKYGLRWYLAGVGSWTQQDTLDNPLDPSNADRYAYAGSDPINNIDPLGQSFAHDLGGAILGAVVGTAITVTTCALTGVETALAGSAAGLIAGATVGGAVGAGSASVFNGDSPSETAEHAGIGAAGGFLASTALVGAAALLP